MLRRRGDHGFTLVEMLITVSILGMITLAIGSALVSFTKNTDATIERLGESHDAQITAAYFGQDVSSMGLRSATAPYAFVQSVNADPLSKELACGSTGTPVVRLGWDDPTSATDSEQVRVAYVIQQVGGERQLHRLVCRGSANVLVSDTVMAHNVAGTPAVSCAPACDGYGNKLPATVTMVLYIQNPDTTVTLTGQRRQTP
jgi:prepilin-type N-terminal cleavage/methylation domain-containing protein